MHHLQTAILKLWIHLKSMHEHWPVLWTLKLGMGTLTNQLNYLTSVNKAQTSLYHKFVAFLWHHLTKPNGRLFSNKNFVSLKRPFGEQCWTIGYFWKNFGLKFRKVSQSSSLARSLFLGKTAVKTFGKGEVTICARLEIISSEPL